MPCGSLFVFGCFVVELCVEMVSKSSIESMGPVDLAACFFLGEA